MLGDVKKWLDDHKYKFILYPELGSEYGKTVTARVPLAGLSEGQCKDLFVQLDEWLANGVKAFNLIEIKGDIFATFTVPLDTVYTLIFIENGVRHFVYETVNRNEALGFMLDRFINVRDDERSIIYFATFDRNKAHISCKNKETSDKFLFDWIIVDRTVPFCG